MRAHAWIVYILLVLANSTSAAQPAASDVHESAQNLALTANFYEDPSGELSLDEVLGLKAAGEFTPNSRDQIHFGMTRSTYWVHFSLDWSALPAGSSRIVEIGPPKIVEGRTRGGAQLFVLDAANRESINYRLGTLSDPRELTTLSRGHAFRVDASLGDEYYLRISSAAPLRTALRLWDESQFNQQSLLSDTGLTFMYGVLLAMVFFNLFQFFSIRERSYLLYVIAIGTQAAFLFLDSHHLRFLLGPGHANLWIVDLLERLVYPAMVMSFIAFQRSLLNISDNNPLLDKIGRWYLAVFALIALAAFIPDEKFFQLPFVALLATGLPIAFYSNIDAIRRGDRSAKIHMAAMGAYMLGGTLLMLSETVPGFPHNSVTANAYNVGQIAQALLLSLSLSARYILVKREKEEAQKLAIENLVRAERVKDDLLANVSHELRTPLFGINGLAEGALLEFHNNTQNVGLITKNLELIQASGDRLTMLVNDLLDFSSSKDADAYMKLHSVDMQSLATLVIAICSPLVGDKPIRLVNRVSAELPLIAGDQDRLQQILVNLISNSIKFTHSGEISVAAELTSPSDVRISVRDTGIGIHESDHDAIFKSFEKLPSKHFNSQGVGLGLPIAKRMIEMHRSTLEMSSELEVGTEFSFSLRVALDQDREIAASTVSKQMIRRADFMRDALSREATPTLKSEQETTVLIVDDDEINRVVMSQQLSEYTIINCSNGMDALTAVAEKKPDLILLDLMMPGLNGYEVCEKLRLRYSPIELPIILVTAKNHLEDLTEGFRTGANDYLPKPFHNEELVSRVENQLKLSMLHKVNEDNIRLRALIKSYSAADTELRGSRMQLQKILETIDYGFVAFETPGKIFSLNHKAAELLGTDKDSLTGIDVASLLTASQVNSPITTALAEWESGESRSSDSEEPQSERQTLINYRGQIEISHPFGALEKSAATVCMLAVRLTLFGSDEGTGVLFLSEPQARNLANESTPDAEGVTENPDERLLQDTVELIGALGQAQQNVRRISARLSVLTPDDLGQHPALVSELENIDRLVSYLDSALPEASYDGEYRQQLVTLMRSALHAWEVTTQKSKIELAEESNIWAVSIDDGRLRTRTFDRYSRIEHLPKVPRWREVVRTAYFVLSIPTIEPETRATLESELEKTKAILKKAAIS